MQIHDKADITDVVLRDQISKIVFLFLPQISAVLIKVCQEETFKGSSVVVAALKALGRFLCLVFEDYERKMSRKITNEDFKAVVLSITEQNETSVLTPNNQTKAEYITSLQKSSQWIQEASMKVGPAIVRVQILRGNDNREIREELVTFSWNLLQKCLPNIKSFAPFLVENLLISSDDSDAKIRNYSLTCLTQLNEILPELSQLTSDILSSHLISLPRIILTGDESEQIAGLALLNSFIATSAESNSLLSNPAVLEKLINILLSCCEIEVPKNLLLYENLSDSSLDDKFYRMKMPWKSFKHLKSEKVVSKFNEICHNIGKSATAEICVNYLQDNINSIEYLVLLIEILYSQEIAIPLDQVEAILEEFLSDTYWMMKIKPSPKLQRTQKHVNEEWFQESTPGLYESAVEVRLRDIDLNDDSEAPAEVNLKTIKFNILSTCLVLELVGAAVIVIKNNFRKYLLRSLHRVLEKAGSSNFLIRTAGIYTLEKISSAMGYSGISQLIDEHSDFLLFNIQKLLKRKSEEDSILDMLSVVFKYSKTSMTSYIRDIIRTASDQISNKNYSCNTLSHLKLFHIYAQSVGAWDSEVLADYEETPIGSEWSEFLEHKLEEPVTEVEEPSEVTDKEAESDQQGIENEQEMEKEDPLPEHINLIIIILTSSLQYFASQNQSEVIIVHEIFIESFPFLHRYENEFLPMVHQMWYPFTKQFQVKNLLTLQFSFRLLVLTARLAKDFIHKRSMDDVIPVINKFLSQISKSSNPTYTQEFKLTREILSGYGSLAASLDMREKDLDIVVDILLKFSKHTSEDLVAASAESLKVLRKHDPGLICFKEKFQ